MKYRTKQVTPLKERVHQISYPDSKKYRLYFALCILQFVAKTKFVGRFLCSWKCNKSEDVWGARRIFVLSSRMILTLVTILPSSPIRWFFPNTPLISILGEVLPVPWYMYYWPCNSNLIFFSKLPKLNRFWFSSLIINTSHWIFVREPSRS